jgi:hypothetical protein
MYSKTYYILLFKNLYNHEQRSAQGFCFSFKNILDAGGRKYLYKLEYIIFTHNFLEYRWNRIYR